jgi:uncharacterized membrane protein
VEFFRYSFLFFFGGVAGWVLELFFRRFISQHKWVNPGFLDGPFLPLYGFGVVAFYLFSSLPWKTWVPNEGLSYLAEIVSIGAALTAIEYIAGLIFIKGMKVKLWDYSNRPGNIQGIICPLFSLIWTAIGAFYIFFLHAGFVRMSTWVIDSSRILFSTTLIGLAYGVIIVDFGYSVHLVTKVRTAVADSKLVVSWDNLKLSMAESAKRAQSKMPWLLPFQNRVGDFKVMVKQYVSELNANNIAMSKELEAKQQAKKEKAIAKIKAHQEKRKLKEEKKEINNEDNK